MESILENFLSHRQPADAKDNDICPALVVGDTVMCSAFERLYQPCNRQIREYCTNEHHIRCSLRRAV